MKGLMKPLRPLYLPAIFLATLLITLPVAFALESNLIYDNNGNLLSGDGKFREYNGLNQLTKIYNGSNTSAPLLQEFVHDPVEERIVIKIDHTKDETTYYFSKENVRVINASGTYDFEYIYHGDQLVAQVNPDNSKLFIHGDHLGSTSTVTNEAGAVVENTSYSPFGEILTGGTASRFGYEGKEYDSIVGDTDFHFRKYSPGWGLFLQPDTLIQNVYDPQSLNRYMFERGNPYKYTDEDGHIAIETTIALTIATFGFAYAGYEVYNQLHYTGSIYSLSRVGDAFGRGIGSGVVSVVGLYLAITTGGMAEPIFSAYGLYSTYGFLEESDSAVNAYLETEECQADPNCFEHYIQNKGQQLQNGFSSQANQQANTDITFGTTHYSFDTTKTKNGEKIPISIRNKYPDVDWDKKEPGKGICISGCQD